MCRRQTPCMLTSEPLTQGGTTIVIASLDKGEAIHLITRGFNPLRASLWTCTQWASATLLFRKAQDTFWITSVVPLLRNDIILSVIASERSEAKQSKIIKFLFCGLLRFTRNDGLLNFKSSFPKGRKANDKLKQKKEEGKYLYSLSSSKEGFSHIAILFQIATMPYCLN